MTPARTPERPTLPKALRRDSLWTFVMLGLSAFLWTRPMPTSFLVFVSGAGAIYFAISALVNSRGVEAVAGIRVWLGIAIGMGCMIVFGGISLVIMRGPGEALEACLERALTQQAKRECQVEFEKSSQELIDRLQNYGVNGS